MIPRSVWKAGLVMSLAVVVAGCGGTKEFIRSKDFRDRSPAARATGIPSPVANVPDMPGWTTDLDTALAFATENPQKTVLFIQQSGAPQTETIKAHLISSDVENAIGEKQRVTLNTATAADVLARYGVQQAPAVVLIGPGGIPESQKAGKISKAELQKYLR